MQVGLREANQQFSRIAPAIRGGEEVLLTERGKPILPIRRSRRQATIQQLVKEGLLRPAKSRASCLISSCAGFQLKRRFAKRVTIDNGNPCLFRYERNRETLAKRAWLHLNALPLACLQHSFECSGAARAAVDLRTPGVVRRAQLLRLGRDDSLDKYG